MLSEIFSVFDASPTSSSRAKKDRQPPGDGHFAYRQALNRDPRLTTMLGETAGDWMHLFGNY
jgi:hypothetical protein